MFGEIEAHGWTGLGGDNHGATLPVGTSDMSHGVRVYANSLTTAKLSPEVSAGLDYSGLSLEHAQLKDSGRVLCVIAADEQALWGLTMPTQLECSYPQEVFSSPRHYPPTAIS